MYPILNHFAHLVRHNQAFIIRNNATVGGQIDRLIDSVRMRNRLILALGFALAGVGVLTLAGIALSLWLVGWLVAYSGIAAILADKLILGMDYHQTYLLIKNVAEAERYAYAQERLRGRFNNRVQTLGLMRIGLVARTIELHTTNACAEQWFPVTLSQHGLFLGRHKIERQEVAWSQCPVGLRFGGVCVQPHAEDHPAGPTLKAAAVETWAYDTMTAQTKDEALGVVILFAGLGILGAIVAGLVGFDPNALSYLAVQVGLMLTWLVVVAGLNNRNQTLQSMREVVKDKEVTMVTVYHHGDVLVLK